MKMLDRPTGVELLIPSPLARQSQADQAARVHLATGACGKFTRRVEVRSVRSTYAS
jgi:hypothetical protein